MNRPKLILLVGPPGCGKTTYAQEYIKEHINTIWMSSDKIREELWGSEATQGDNNKVFALMQSRTIETLNNGMNVIYDCTNMTRNDRSYIISLCPKFTQIEAHIIWTTIEECIKRDASRERSVGKEVIDRMLKRFQAPYYDEGIDQIKIIRPSDFDEERYYYDCDLAMSIPHDNPNHTLDIDDHCFMAGVYARKHSNNTDVIRAAELHDLGKPYTKAFVDGKGNPCEIAHYFQHQCISAWLSYGFSDITPYATWLIAAHMEPFFNSKYYNNLPPFLKRDLDLLHEADLAAH